MDAAKPICPRCESILTRWAASGRYQCLDCGKLIAVGVSRVSGGNCMKPETQVRIVSAVVEGNGIRGIARMVGVSTISIQRLLLQLGEACSRFEDARLRDLTTRRIQCDEMWSFVHTKRKNLAPDEQHTFGLGDVWTWLAIDEDSRVVVTWRMGPRDSSTAEGFMRDVASRFRHKVALTTDGFRVYMRAVGAGFKGDAVDHEMITQAFDPTRKKMPSTNYAERQNLTMRTTMRRFMRRTNGYSKSLRYHAAACGLHFAHYNFVRVHQGLRVTPAMEAGIEDHVWSIKELICLIDGSVVQPPRLFAGPNAQQFCMVCGQAMSVERRDSVCSRHCRSQDINHMDDVA